MTVAVYETTARAGSRKREARAGGAEGADGTPGLSLCHNGPQLPPSTPAWPELADTESIGFRGRDAVELAAAFLPAMPAPRRPEEHYEGIGTVTVDGPVDRVLIVGPGMVQVRVHDPRSKDAASDLLGRRRRRRRHGWETEAGAGRPARLPQRRRRRDDDAADAGRRRPHLLPSLQAPARDVRSPSSTGPQPSRTATAWPSSPPPTRGTGRPSARHQSTPTGISGRWRSGSSGPPVARSWASGSGSSSAGAPRTSTC